MSKNQNLSGSDYDIAERRESADQEEEEAIDESDVER